MDEVYTQLCQPAARTPPRGEVDCRFLLPMLVVLAGVPVQSYQSTWNQVQNATTHALRRSVYA